MTLVLFYGVVGVVWATEEKTTTKNFSNPCVSTEKIKRLHRLFWILGGLGVTDQVKTLSIGPSLGSSRYRPKGDTLDRVYFILKLHKDGSCSPYDANSLDKFKKINPDKNKGELVIFARAYAVRPENMPSMRDSSVKDITKYINSQCSITKLSQKQYGLDAYQTEGNCLKSMPKDAIKDRYMFVNEAKEPVSFIRCPKYKSKEYSYPMYTNCTHRFFYKDENHNTKTHYFDYPPIYFKLIYEKKYLPYWREIETAVRQYFDSVTFDPYTLQPMMEKQHYE